MKDTNGLCYPSCESGYAGVGPVCWGTCPAVLPTECAAGCAESTQQCVQTTFTQIRSVVEFSSQFLGMIPGASKAVGILKKVKKVVDVVAKVTDRVWTSSTPPPGT